MTNPTIITLHLRLPSKELRANARVHWAAKSKATKRDREYAYIMALAAKGNGKYGWVKAKAQAVFTVKNDRNDQLNLGGWLKAYFDGLQDAGIIRNDNGVILERVQMDVGTPEGVTIVLERVK